MTDLTPGVAGREIVRKFRHEIPARHRQTLDTRLLWLWQQRFGTVQQVWRESPDLDDKLAATIGR